jgi:regulator of RNase E activity RraA
MQEVGFFAFASCVLVSHAYVHLTDVGVPVKVGGLEVSPGDIIQGDQHGVLRIPRDIAADIPDAVRRIERNEQELIGYAQSAGFTVDGLKEMLSQR